MDPKSRKIEANGGGGFVKDVMTYTVKNNLQTY